MPYRSAGCQTCKIRRIKCDETKPTCQRCTKSGRVCLETNATKQVTFSIHLENLYASGKTKRPRGPRSSLTIFRPNFDLPSRAVAYYLNYYLHALAVLPTASACMSDCLISWKDSRRECSMVDLAVSSVALAIFSRTQQHSPAAREAFLRYNQLLRVAREEITRKGILRCDERGIDECLLAVVLMGRYETTMHRPANLTSKDSFSSLHSWSHHDGAMAILKVWHDKLSHKTPSSIITQARRGMIRSALLRNRPLPDWMRDGSRFGEHNMGLSFDRILVRIVNLRYAFRSLEQKKDILSAEAAELNNSARELDEACREWAAQIPSARSYQPHIITGPSSWPRRDFYSSTIYSYAQPTYAAVWIQYFAARMLINSTRLRLLQLCCPAQFLDFTYREQHRECTTYLKAMADSLASTIPFSLGRVMVDNVHDHSSRNSKPVITFIEDEIRPALALLTVWPLSMASSLDGVDPGQQLWFRSELARLGRILGDGVLECAGDSSLWATT
ncbi:hypothetical protein V490_08267 [Pseudogymnoascus sp. VKM F-3557]|nr:hypothetical protein V490_08267 [Pseudogymnoascus sp. VKM F-3557]